jgi:PAS domain S-box-containing protein
VIFLSDHMDEAAVDAALNAGTGAWVQTSNGDEPSIRSTIRYAIDAYGKERQRQKAEDTLRKLWRALEQSADLVMITDREGVIEYVNPAFESLTGYSPGELMGQTPRILKSGQQSSEFCKELWQTILSGTVSLHHGEPQKEKKRMETFSSQRRPLLPCAMMIADMVMPQMGGAKLRNQIPAPRCD